MGDCVTLICDMFASALLPLICTEQHLLLACEHQQAAVVEYLLTTHHINPNAKDDQQRFSSLHDSGPDSSCADSTSHFDQSSLDQDQGCQLKIKLHGSVFCATR